MHDKRKRNSGRSTFFTRVFKDFCDSSTHYSSKLASLADGCASIICNSKRANELGLELKYSYSWDPTQGGTLTVQASDRCSLVNGLKFVGNIKSSNLKTFVANFSKAGVTSKLINTSSGMIIRDIGEKEFFRCHPLLYIPMRDIPRNNFVAKIFAYLSEIPFYDLPTDIITPVSGCECYDTASRLQYTYGWSMEMGGELIIKSGENTLDSLLDGLHMVAGIESRRIKSILENIRKIGYSASYSNDHYVLTISDRLPGNLESFRCHPLICGTPRLSRKRVKCSVVETQSTGGSDVDCLMQGLVPPMQVPSVSPVHGLLGNSPAQTLMRPEASSAAHKPLSNNEGESGRSDDAITLQSHDKGETGTSNGIDGAAMSKNIAQRIFVDFMRNAGITSQADIETNQTNYAKTKSISDDVQYTYTYRDGVGTLTVTFTGEKLERMKIKDIFKDYFALFGIKSESALSTMHRSKNSDFNFHVYRSSDLTQPNTLVLSGRNVTVDGYPNIKQDRRQCNAAKGSMLGVAQGTKPKRSQESAEVRFTRLINKCFATLKTKLPTFSSPYVKSPIQVVCGQITLAYNYNSKDKSVCFTVCSDNSCDIINFITSSSSQSNQGDTISSSTVTDVGRLTQLQFCYKYCRDHNGYSCKYKNCVLVIEVPCGDLQSYNHHFVSTSDTGMDYEIIRFFGAGQQDVNGQQPISPTRIGCGSSFDVDGDVSGPCLDGSAAGCSAGVPRAGNNIGTVFVPPGYRGDDSAFGVDLEVASASQDDSDPFGGVLPSLPDISRILTGQDEIVISGVGGRGL